MMLEGALLKGAAGLLAWERSGAQIKKAIPDCRKSSRRHRTRSIRPWPIQLCGR